MIRDLFLIKSFNRTRKKNLFIFDIITNNFMSLFKLSRSIYIQTNSKRNETKRKEKELYIKSGIKPPTSSEFN